MRKKVIKTNFYHKFWINLGKILLVQVVVAVICEHGAFELVFEDYRDVEVGFLEVSLQREGAEAENVRNYPDFLHESANYYSADTVKFLLALRVEIFIWSE